MSHIERLDKSVYELIAAGEVIERPASVVKELIENSIDSGAKHIQIEIKHGGIVFIRVTDDGCGIFPEDVKNAFERHATSKISKPGDLENISTLGFRGEALASVAAVSKVNLLTKRKELEEGISYSINEDFAGSVTGPENVGCPDGTTIIIHDLFFNVPARRKFLKKEVTEGNAVSFIVRKCTLSHPGVSFKFIRDNSLEFVSSGKGDLKSAIYTIYGKDFTRDLISVNYELNNIKVSGYIIKPLYSKANRHFQNFFVDSRYISSKLLSSALESGYENLVMTGKFPACVLNIYMPPSSYDVNCHPQKAEVRFTNEKDVSDAIYFAVKNALTKANLIYDFSIPTANPNREWKEKSFAKDIETYQPNLSENIAAPSKISKKNIEEKIQNSENSNMKSERSIKADLIIAESDMLPAEDEDDVIIEVNKPLLKNSFQQKYTGFQGNDVLDDSSTAENNFSAVKDMPKYTAADRKPETLENDLETSENKPLNQPKKRQITVIGEAFKKYIIAESDDSIYLIDKHAAHERILFEKLKRGVGKQDQQYLLTPCRLLVSSEEFDALSENQEKLSDLGFLFDFSNAPEVILKAEPGFIENMDEEEIISEIAANLMNYKANPQTQVFNDLLHSIACKAAIKANYNNINLELQYLTDEVFRDYNVRHCPHGRPIVFKLTEYEIDKNFRRKGI